jgi:tetrahydromethanopterin S-methyltransferase subunit A
MNERSAPPLAGDYVVGDGGCVAVLIIGRGAVELPSDSFRIKGIMKTENIGLEKVVLNIVADPAIRFLVVCGKEEFGHFPADAIAKLMVNGLDEHKRIIGARSAIPYLCNLTPEIVTRFRAQVELVDLVHPKEVTEIVAMDPIYQFEAERQRELLEKVRQCASRDPGPFPGEPLLVESVRLKGTGAELGKNMHKAADTFIAKMLRMPSEELSTRSSLIIIDEEMGAAIEPIDAEVFLVPSVELAIRLKEYFTGC